MDKKTTLGFVLIGIVLMIWMWQQAPPPATQVAGRQDSLQQTTLPAKDSLVERRAPAAKVAEPAAPADSLGRFFAGRETGAEKVITIKTDLYTAEVTTKGGLLRKWELANFKTWDKHPVQMVDYDGGGDLSVLFTSTDGRLINTRELYFECAYTPWQSVELKGDEKFTVELSVRAGTAGRLIKRLTFENGKYSFDCDFVFRGMDSVVSNFEYEILWERGLRYAEENSVDESSYAMAYAYSGGELAEVDATKPGEAVKEDINGATNWVATRSKYFLVALLADEGSTQGAYLEGHRSHLADKGEKETYSIALKMPFRGGKEESSHISVYAGPLDYDIVKSYGRNLQETMNLGAAWIIRPISEYVMIPLFTLLHSFIPNYGIVIIVFSIIIKIALHPLTRSSMRSMKRMQALSPLLSEVKAKYKDNPEKMNQQVMNLYKEYGINPAAGCLPLLLQMPILFALWAVLRSSIELRQAGFAGWIQDLSIPDTVLTLPFTVPFFGITKLSGVALAMGVTMFVQQKMSTMDPRQKAMIWMMPILMTLIFNNLPSGLNLYYFVFNILSIGQQMWINKQHGDEPLRKVDPKKRNTGIMAKLTKGMPKMR
jgi:YidC/Oxa1 family membrane protein insertase